MNKTSLLQRSSWFLIFILMLGVISAGIITNITLRSVEEQLPNKLLTELNDLSLVLDDLSNAVISATIFLDDPNLEKLNALSQKIKLVHQNTVKLRESYVIDNLVQASAFHSIVAPAVADLQIWLDEGFSELNTDKEIKAKIIFIRIHDAYKKARLVNKDSRIQAQAKLMEQQKRLSRFITNVNALFVLTIAVTIGMMFLMLRQYAMQLRESEVQLKLIEQRDLLSSLFENVPVGLTLWSKKGGLLFINQKFTELTGYSKDHVKNLDDWFPLAYPDENYRNKVISDWKGMSTKEEIIRQFEVTCKSGETKDIEFRGTFLKDGRALVTLSDMTWRVKAEEEKIKSQKLIAEHKKLSLVGQIAGKMAHDFNNILMIIMGNAQILLAKNEEENTVKRLNLIYDQTVRGKNLTKNLIAFAKDQEPKQEFFKTNEKIDLVINLLKKDLEDIKIIKQCSTTLPDLLADPGMIEHALVNLLQNSIHALSKIEYPEITIRTFSIADDIFIEIEDNGCGIPKNQLENIYEPSFSLKGSRDELNSYAPGIKGTGYGMANVKKYVEQHNGFISVTSDHNSGTKITVSLPIIEKELTENEKIELNEEMIFSGKNILLVEDEKFLSDVQYHILTNEPCNHKVDIAGDGQAAIDLFDKNIYDFISLDYVLPRNLSGMSVYEYVRGKNRTIPILFISGNIEFLESVKELKQKDPFVDHLSKPCTNKDYIRGINRLLGSAN